jgi:tRNA pseudouridine38-40 synthase
LNVQEVILEFHAQKSVLQKQYSYYFQQGPSSLPHFESYSWWIRKELQVQAMSEALRTLIGKQDYRAFQASGAKPGPTVREILEADVTTEPLPFPSLYPLVDGFALVRVRIVGTGFLKQMVRGIVGTLLQVGEGRRAGSILKEIQETQSRSLVGPTAPARGLWLERVWYPTLFGLNG